MKSILQTAAAPIERVKLLVQNQDEMIKQGRLDKPYKGVIDCTARTFRYFLRTVVPSAQHYFSVWFLIADVFISNLNLTLTLT